MMGKNVRMGIDYEPFIYEVLSFETTICIYMFDYKSFCNVYYINYYLLQHGFKSSLGYFVLN
jgi:hypothetical protein